MDEKPFFKGCDTKTLIASWIAVFIVGALACNAVLNPIYYHEMKRQEASYKRAMGNMRGDIGRKIDGLVELNNKCVIIQTDRANR